MTPVTAFVKSIVLETGARLLHSGTMRARPALLMLLLLACASWAGAGSITVQDGDTLWDLAQRHGVGVDELMAANGLTRSDLRPGDVLTLPGDDAPTPAAVQATWTVRPGDTLYDIAVASDTTTDALMAVNDLDAAVIHPGDVLILPKDASLASSSPSDGPEAATRSSETWTVEPGDTLYDIARRTGTTVTDLLAWNALPGSTIRPGDVLALGPAGSDARLEPLTVAVGPGDSLWRIARLHDSTPTAIASANGIAVDAILQPGDVLTIPGAYLQAGAQTDRGGFAAPTITVDPGDTLWEIARRYDTTVDALMNANDLTGSSLRAGQELRVVAPDGRSAPVAVAARPQDAVAAQAMVWPLDGPITSRFGWRALRIGGSNMHYGLDIDGHTGDPILSATHGTVTYADWMGGFGKLVIVERDGTEYYYAHASELLVRVGQQVAPGALIARVGTTGRVTGSHLHFEIRVDGEPLDPLPILEARATRR